MTTLIDEKTVPGPYSQSSVVNPKFLHNFRQYLHRKLARAIQESGTASQSLLKPEISKKKGGEIFFRERKLPHRK